MRRQGGYTLVELLVIMSITGVLLTLGATAVRNFYQRRALVSAQDEIVTQLRTVQQRVVAESNGRVYGARFRVDSSRWDTVRYITATNTCSIVQRNSFEGGVEVSAVSFADSVSGLNLAVASPAGPIPACDALVAGTDEFVFFLARGTGTPGNVTVINERLADRTRSVSVSELTGRVDES